MTGSPDGTAAFYLAARKAADGTVIGFDVAVDSLAAAFLRYAGQDRLYCYARDEREFEAFRARATEAGRDAARCVWIPYTEPHRLAEAGCLLHPDPNIAPYTWPRRRVGADAYSLCGITHTMSSANEMESVANCVHYPTAPWDAIICPSRAIAAAIRALWGGWQDYLAERTGGQVECPVQLPVIPLGVDTARFAVNRDPARRQAQRAELGLSDDALAILFHGRISFYSKAHPLPLLMAAEGLAAARDTPVHLLFYGYFPGESFAAEFHALAADICTRATVTVIENSDARFPDGVWAGADMFVSLSDNIQESFGLTPVEAMASGLPVVVSDWDGYRDTVTDGVEGFTVPTMTLAPGLGAGIADRYLNGEFTYGHYLAAASQSTAVDSAAVAQAIARLAEDPDLRRRMGEAGMRRAAAVYDWRNVIPAYEALWAELAQRRKADGGDGAAARGTHPLRPDPYRLFADFPTRHMSPEDVVEPAAPMDALTALLKHRMNMFTPDVLLDPDALTRLVQNIHARPGCTVSDLSSDMPEASRPRLSRTLAWLVKLGYLRLVGPDEC
jgi:glycosyltransferase involved in cell wall biosynthesis